MNSDTQSASAPVALITGAARRIGAVIAEHLHACGYAVVIQHQASAREAAALVARLEQVRPGSAITQRTDLGDLAALTELVEVCVARFGRLDVLINNAASFPGTTLERSDGQAWDAMFAINCKAPFFLAQAAAPHLRRVHGSIINITDLYARHPKPGAPVYCATQAALESLTRSLAIELAPQVRVNAVAPGAILAPAASAAASALAPDRDHNEFGIIAKTPLARCGTPQEIAAAVLFLARDAGFITGQVITADGGRTLAC